jgi:hypothetical protein
MKYIQHLLLLITCLVVFACSKKSPPEPVVVLPNIPCGDSLTVNCISDQWIISKPATASYTIIPNDYAGKNSLFLHNPHSSTQVNPPSISFTTVIKNIKKNTAYRISCDAKINGYPDVVNAPGFAFYAYSNDTWYGEHYYFTTPGLYHASDWSTHSYVFLSGEESTLYFQFYSLYDSTWISNFQIKEF